jgi:hypothetical protein
MLRPDRAQLILPGLRSALARSGGVRFDELALSIATLDETPFERAQVLEQLDVWGEKIARESRGSLLAGVDALERLLGREIALTGDRDTFDAPVNSFLPRVLERKRGLPITLSIVYVEVARRANLPLFGVSLPGHFVAGYAFGEKTMLIDPFDSGRKLTEVDALANQVDCLGNCTNRQGRAIDVGPLPEAGDGGERCRSDAAQPLWHLQAPQRDDQGS